jgi:hypothetical protein
MYSLGFCLERLRKITEPPDGWSDLKCGPEIPQAVRSKVSYATVVLDEKWQWPVYRANNSYTLVLRLRMFLRLLVRIALSIKLSSTSLPVHLRMGTDPVSISIKLSRNLTTF